MNQAAPPRLFRLFELMQSCPRLLNADVVAELLGAPWCADLHVNDEEALLWAADNGHEVGHASCSTCCQNGAFHDNACHSVVQLAWKEQPAENSSAV